ncbi:hypothetical protein EXW96_23870 [Paenibacillus sp. JMULE4]|uniref:sigma-70 family RNA polymerase sigma factor n=1 Tax=Paenibacillus sp. JMULE4 TaxID=2518342 RepID=UPI00157777CC|nr:hypothetical protein [Paenibacillus sp. JMULE4]
MKKIIYSKYAISDEFRRRHFDDLLQEARIALFQSIQAFDKSKAGSSKDSLWSYAVRRIEGRLKDELSRSTGSISAPLRIKTLAAKIKTLEHAVHDKQLHSKLGIDVRKVKKAVEYLKNDKSVSIDDLIFSKKRGESRYTLLEVLSESANAYEDYFIQEFNSLLDSKEKEVLFYLLNDYSKEELPQLIGRDRNQIDQIVASLGIKADVYFDLEHKKTEDIKMTLKKSSSKSLSESQYIELKGQGISDKEIARRHRMSPTTLRKLRNQWSDSSSAGLMVNQSSTSSMNTVSLEEFNALQRAYQNLKYEYELLWRYHKQSLLRMESPYLWTE